MKYHPFHSKRGCLSYLLVDEVSKEAAVIDPSQEIASQDYLDALQKHEATLRYIIETHTHADHKGRAHSTIGEERSHNSRFLLPRDEFIETLDAHHPPKPDLFETSIAANSL